MYNFKKQVAFHFVLICLLMSLCADCNKALIGIPCSDAESITASKYHHLLYARYVYDAAHQSHQSGQPVMQSLTTLGMHFAMQ